MSNSCMIEKLYFIEHLDTIEIAERLDISKQAVSKTLKKNWPERYEVEKTRRKAENKEKRNHKKIKSITEKRQKLSGSNEYDYICLKLQHEQDVRGMSKGSKLSTERAVFLNLSAYDVDEKHEKLKYNNKFGKRPKDLPASLKLIVYV